MTKNPFHSEQKLGALVATLKAFPLLDASDLITNILDYQSEGTHSVHVPKLLQTMLNDVFSLEIALQQLPMDAVDNKSRVEYREALQCLQNNIPAEIKAHEDHLSDGMRNTSPKVIAFFGPLVSRVDRIDDDDRTALLMHLCSFKDYRIDFIVDGLYELSDYIGHLWENEQNERLKMAIDEALAVSGYNSTIESFSEIISSRLK